MKSLVTMNFFPICGYTVNCEKKYTIFTSGIEIENLKSALNFVGNI